MIKEKKTLIENILKNSEKARDNDQYLAILVWNNEIENFSSLSMKEFAKLFVSGKVTSTETIRRCRQKLQELNPQYRGLSYKQRHKNTEKVKKELKEI